MRDKFSEFKNSVAESQGNIELYANSAKADSDKIKDILAKNEAKYKTTEEILNTIKPTADRIAEYVKDIKGIKGEYQMEFSDLYISEKLPEETKEKLDEVAKKSEFLEGIGVELGPEDFFNRRLDYSFKGEYKKANEEFAKATRLKPDYANAWDRKGIALDRLGKFEESLKSFDKAIELQPDHSLFWYNRACTYSLKRDKGKALENLHKAIELDLYWKEHAKKDEDFKDLWDDDGFKKIVA